MLVVPCHARSGDSTARIWDLTAAATQPRVLTHFKNNDDKGKDVTTLDWSVRIATLPPCFCHRLRLQSLIPPADVVCCCAA